MKVYTETNLTNLTYDELEQIESILEDAYPDGMSETQINDIFWFEEDWIAGMLGYKDFEELMHRDDEEEEEEE